MPSEPDHTSLALLEQLVYIDLYLRPGFENETPSSFELDEQLSMDLAMFADDAFVFPDETKGSASNSGNHPEQGGGDDDGPVNRSPIVGSSSDTFPRYPNHRDAIAANNNDLISSLGNRNPFGGPNATGRFGLGLSRGRESAFDSKSRQENALVPKPFGDHGRSADAAIFANYEVSANPSTYLNPEPFQISGAESHRVELHKNVPVLPQDGRGPSSFLRHSSITPIPVSGSDTVGLAEAASSHLTDLPRFPVPPGAELSLRSVGLLQNQIDLLSALIAQHQANTDSSAPASQGLAERSLPHTLPPPLSLRTGRQSEQRPSIGAYSSYAQRDSLALSMSPARASFTDINTSASDSNSTEPKIEQTHEDLADMDKRRRNTAALARFRVKKKIKEQSMDSKLRTMEQTAREFEEKIQRLEMENKLLRTLIVERGSKKSDEELEDLRQRAAKR